MLGEKSYLVSAVGEDALGQSALEQLRKFDVNTDYVSVLQEKETGKCFVTLNENAVPTYKILDGVSYDYIHMPKIEEGIDVVSFGTLALRRENNKKILTQILKPLFVNDPTRRYGIFIENILKN